MRLSLSKINSLRGNYYFANVNKNDCKIIEYDGCVYGYLDKNNQLFEPAFDKGDVARAIIYMHLVYDLEYPYLSQMRKWALNDNPKEDELNHYKNVINSQTLMQKNILVVNPFVTCFLNF